MSFAWSPGLDKPVTPQKATEALPVSTGTHPPPAASISSQVNTEFIAPERSFPGSATKAPPGQGMSIRAFIEGVPASSTSPSSRHMGIARATAEYRLATMEENQESVSTGEMPTPNSKKRSSMLDKLCRILDCIKAEDLSLPRFLVELFKSDDRAARDYTNSFYEANGPQRLVQVWDKQLRGNKRHERWDETFVNSAVDVAVDRTLKHLKHDDVKNEWRLPYTEVTEERISRYLLDDFGFLRRYGAGTADDENDGTRGKPHAAGGPNRKGKNGGAKYLVRFLKGVLEEDLPPENPLKRSRARNPSSVRGCISAMLLFMSSQQTNAFQTIFGIFLHSTGCPKRVLEVLSGLGLSISPSQVRNCLDSLTKDASNRVIQAVKENGFFVVYDNINIANKHHHQRSNNRDTFDNGTAATIVLSGKDKQAPTLFRQIDEMPDAVADLFFPNDDDFEVFFNACQSHVSDSIVLLSPEKSTMSAIPMVTVEQLDPVKSTFFPLKVMRLDESTIAGNLSVLQRITEVGLQLPDTWFSNPGNTLIAGDQMTVSRLLTLKVHRSFDPNRYHSLSWVHPVLQLFHLEMNLCGTIWRTHLGTAEFHGTLTSIAILLQRRRLIQEKPTFHDTSELLQIIFDAKIQQLYQCQRDRGVSDKLAVQNITESIIRSCCSQPSLSLLGLPCTTANTNALLFLRDVAVFIELGTAIKAGDIGRIKHVLPLITLMMHGGGNTNYAPELLRLLYGIRHLWTDEWAQRVLSSMLVNPKGIAGGWMATDMMQENHNYLLKAIFSAKGSNMTWEYLQESISTNIKTFQSISRMFEQEVGVRSNSTRHKKPSTSSDITLLQMDLQKAGILWTSGGCPQGPPVANLQTVGEEKMVAIAIGRFFDNHTSMSGNAVDLEEAEGLENIFEDDFDFDE